LVAVGTGWRGVVAIGEVVANLSYVVGGGTEGSASSPVDELVLALESELLDVGPAYGTRNFAFKFPNVTKVALVDLLNFPDGRLKELLSGGDSLINPLTDGRRLRLRTWTWGRTWTWFWGRTWTWFWFSHGGFGFRN
jgi:hypothetical protein